MAEAKEKPPVEITEEKQEGPRTQAPNALQDHNAAMEPSTIPSGIDEDVERVLTDDVHIDMGRGPLTFKPGDTIVIRDGHIIKATTREGMEYDFTPAHVAAAERRASDVRAQDLHQNLSAQPHSTPDAPASPATDPTTELQVGHEGTGAFEETEKAITSQPAGGFEGEEGDHDEPTRASEDAVPVPEEDMPQHNLEGDEIEPSEPRGIGSQIKQADVEPSQGATPQGGVGPGGKGEKASPTEPDKSKKDNDDEPKRDPSGKFAPKED